MPTLPLAVSTGRESRGSIAVLSVFTEVRAAKGTTAR
jgi:hypothetical protein